MIPKVVGLRSHSPLKLIAGPNVQTLQILQSLHFQARGQGPTRDAEILVQVPLLRKKVEKVIVRVVPTRVALAREGPEGKQFGVQRHVRFPQDDKEIVLGQDRQVAVMEDIGRHLAQKFNVGVGRDVGERCGGQSQVEGLALQDGPRGRVALEVLLQGSAKSHYGLLALLALALKLLGLEL
jgi:hypothetical protein